MNSNHWGTTLLGAVLLLLLAGGLYTWHSLRESSRQAEAAHNLEEQDKARAQAERDLRIFAETHLSDLQKLIDEIQNEIQVRQRKLDQLAEEYRKVGVSALSDKDYKAWGDGVTRLKMKLGELMKVRRDTYLALKKFEFDPTGKAEVERQREERLKLARNQADLTRTQFNEMRNTNNPPEPASFTPPKDGDKAKTAPKKRWWLFGY